MTVERIGARRVLIDSLADLQFASGDRHALPRVHVLADPALLARRASACS